ncbi:MAG: polysaccharide biosynthesis tyrosine autokinase [Firmicutes bacterium]|nr:polysaccharide biosynthesis tyrosine autokinase [Bacillota bacterium]
MNTNDNKFIEKNEELEIDLQRLFGALLKRAWMIVAATLICGLVSLGVTQFLITPMYESTAMFYVNNGSLSVGGTSLSLSSSDISVSKSLVDSYIVILKTRETLNDVADYAEIDRSYAELKEMISASAVNDTEIFKVVVTSEDPEEAEKLADAISYLLPKRIANIVEGTSAQIVDHAVLPSAPSSPNVLKNTVLGAMIGFILSIGAIAIFEIFNTLIRSEEDVEQCCTYPVLAVVPDMRSQSKGGYYQYAPHGHGRKSKKKALDKKNLATDENELSFVGANLGFAAAEAYKMLGTKVQFSFADDKDSHVISVSSSLPGEGKSLTSINLAHSLSQLNKRVLLIDCDLRKPTMAQKLGVRQIPGLSNHLVRQCEVKETIQRLKLSGDVIIDVIPAGDIPPNATELLSSDRMSKMIDIVRDAYDVIILDLPPVKEVSDAMVVTNVADGVVLVTRENYCDRPLLTSSIKQFEFVNAKIMGVVLNCSRAANEGGKKYGKYGKYGKYYGRYYGYGKSYGDTHKK